MTAGSVITFILQFGFAGVVAAVVGYLLLTRYATGYQTQKGINLATKEDTAAITREVEKVRTEFLDELEARKHDYSLVIEELRGKSQLRVVAGERRLQAHQEAFTLWLQLMEARDGERHRVVYKECMDWWGRNCVYLTPAASKAFSDACWAHNLHPTLLGLRPIQEHIHKLKINWKIVTDAGNVILAAVDLPPLSPKQERDILAEEPKPKD